MTKLGRRILEHTIRKKEKSSCFLAVFNIATLLAIQELNLDVPLLLKTNILLILGDFLFGSTSRDSGGKQS